MAGWGAGFVGSWASWNIAISAQLELELGLSLVILQTKNIQGLFNDDNIYFCSA